MKRAPNGYRIQQWSDGFYHVYFGGQCLDEVLTRGEAIKIANDHKENQKPVSTVAELLADDRTSDEAAIRLVTAEKLLKPVFEMAVRLCNHLHLPEPKMGTVGGEVCHLSINFTHCWIEAGEVDVKTLRSSVPMTGYVVNQAVITPSVHYYKDGSGQPEEVDIVEVSRSLSAGEALKAALTFDLHQGIENYMEFLSEAELDEVTQ